MEMIISQPASEYNPPDKWYDFISEARAYEKIYRNADIVKSDTHINQDAFFLDQRDYDLLIAHEAGHAAGRDHETFGLMSPYGLIRYLTTW
jgi:Zn-dependent protease with chaperone function